MFKHYLTTALRYFGRNKFTTAINVLCLTMGMVCFAAAYGVVSWFTNADRHYANADRIYFATEHFTPRGTTLPASTGSPMTSWVLGDLLRTEFQQLPAVARLRPGGETPIAFGENKNAFVQAAFADPEFLEIFNLPFLKGDAGALRAPHSAVVTEAMAKRIFGRPDVVGQTVLLANRERVAITGVVSALKQPSHFGGGTSLVNFEMLISMDTYESIVRATSSPTRIKEALGTWAANMNNIVYMLMPEDGSIERDALNARLKDFTKRIAPTDEGTFHVAAYPVWELHATLGDSILGSMGTGVSITTVLLILGGLILLVSCINYANLATAQVSTRAKEIAMRRVVGAGRSEIIRQYIFETALLTGSALALVLVFLLLLLGVLGAVSGINLVSTVLLSSQLWSILAITLIGVTLIAGAYPALVLSRVQPLVALRAGQGASGPRFVPTILVGTQFAAASFLLIALLVMYGQNSALQRQREAVSGVPVISVTTSVQTAGVDMKVLQTELRRSEYIEVVAAADEAPGSIFTGNHRIVGRSLDANAERYGVNTNAIDYDYFKALGINLLAGRMFEVNRRDEWNQNTASAEEVMNIVINRALAEQSGWNDPSQALGQIIYGHAGLGEHALSMRVIGVVETQPVALLGFGMLGNVYSLEPERANLAILRLSKTHTQQGIAALEATWKKLSPNVPLRRVFLDESFDRTFRILPIISNTFAALSMFAFFISAMGLIGMATHVTARRTREIGVRKTLGASVARVLGLLLRDFSKPVIIANLLMWPLAYIVMKGYLSMFMVQTSLSATPFVLGLAITAGIACASVAVQATKAARMNPATVLRAE
jgi:putative ABC transport system permease protein